MRYFLPLFFFLFFTNNTKGQASIQANGATSICGPGTVALSVTGAAGGSTFQWRKDNIDISGANLINYPATATGSYSVIITNANPPDTLSPVNVSITAKPIPDFTFTPNTAVCSGTAIQFNSSVNSGTPPFTYVWDFGGNGTSTSQNPVHAFTSLGCGTASFVVSLTVTDSKGCSSVITHAVSVLQAPDVQLADQNVFSPFSNCSNSPTAANPNYTLTVNNISLSAACIANYNIDWGDGNTQANASFPLTHTYTQLGAYNLTITALGTNGCSNSKTYIIANQSNPAGSLGTLGSTTNLCASANVPFTISNWQINSPGTRYVLDFGDGNSVTLNQPLNAQMVDQVVNHIYTTSSCPASSYTATLRVINACDNTPYTAGNIQIRIKPTADFTITKTPSCTGQSVCFNNTTTAGSYGPSCSTLATYVWDFGDGTAVSTIQSPCHAYTTPGTYTVTLSSTNPCGTTTVAKQVCITSPPSPAFTLSSPGGCIPLSTTATNTTNTFSSCETPTYLWSVTYAPAFCGTTASWNFTAGSATSASPSFIFNNPGSYTITLAVTNACGTYKTSQTIDVKQPPTVSITPPTYPCGPITITPAATVASCGTATPTYAWTFAGGSPATSTALNPGPVNFSGVGSHAITLAVTNECGTTTATTSVTVTAAPDVVVPGNQDLCGGTTAGPFNFSSTVGTPFYSWTNSNPAIGLTSSGTGNIPSFITTNSGTTPLVATITVTPFVNANCKGAPVSFTVTVNPRPASPLVITPLTYCLNAVAPPLSATSTGTNTLTWYNNSALTGGSTTAPTPTVNVPGNTSYYVTQTNSFNCLSSAAVISVRVNPSINGNSIGADQNICANTNPATITTATPNVISGGNNSFSYQWQSSADGGITWGNINSAINPAYLPPSLSATIQYRRIITSSTCSDTSNVVTITVQGALTNFNIAGNQTICAGNIPTILTGQLPTGGGGSYTYLWETSLNNATWTSTGNTGQDYQPTALTQTTYFRRKVFASQCNGISPVITVTVNPTPAATITAVPTSVCEYDAAAVSFNATTGTAPFNIELTISRPVGADTTITRTINNNGPFNITILNANSATGTYTVKLTKITDAKGCQDSGAISTTTITVKPRPILVLSAPPTICNGNNAVLTAGGATSYQWSPSAGLSNTSGSSVTANPLATTTYTVTGTLNNCVTTGTIVVTVTPGTTIANAGANQILCVGGNATLAANQPVTGTGAWTQFSGPAAVITDTTLNTSGVTGLVSGQRYIFQWTIAGIAPCPATTSKVTIDVLSPIINIIQRDTIICSGQSVALQSKQLSGGNTNGLDSSYSFQWEQSTPAQVNWQPIAGATQATLTVSPTSSTCYRRKVKSNNLCDTSSNPVCITVNPTIGNNTISASQLLCINTIPANLVGANPTGGDNNYIYQWQTSLDGLTWSSVGTNINYQPPSYANAGLQYFRRNVTSGNCTSTSNVITITVKPDSKALFTSNPTTACSPFNLAPAINVTPFPDRDGLYQWYADGVLFASNSTGIFPGYTILNAADTVIIKLKTSSQYGCKPDSMEQQFITVITAIAKFTKDTSFGCGPLPVQFTNTSSILNNATQYFWNFGNGITSNLLQPAAIIFSSSPFFNDTTYRVTLKAYNGCDTTIWVDSIKVRANPRARFGVDTTFGCSPFTITISNTSPGGPNTYYWDFGNGVKDTTFTNGSFNYTYNIGNAVDTFTIRLIAENQCRRDTQSINVRVAPNLIRPLINVNSSQLFGCAPHMVSFSNNSSGATSYTWNFGDNTAPVITNNNQSTIVHTYTASGIFTVSIDITNGCSDTTVYRQITVYDKPAAAFTTNAATYCEVDTIRVNNTSANATNYRWFWGDGTSSAGTNPAHTYAVAGNYNIVLRAERTNASGTVCIDTLVRPITVLAKPVVTIQSNINTINCAPFKLNVTAPGIINENISWYIYDSTVSPSIIVSNNISTQYIFNKPGSFYVKLVAVNAQGCKDSTILRFTVRGNATASFTPSDLAVCTTDTTVTYLNTTTYNGTDPISYRWLVDNVLISTSGNFTHRYNVLPAAVLPKVFNTKLVVSNTVGCSDTAEALLQINPFPKAQFSITNPNDCVPFKPVIVNASAYTSSYRWLLNGVLVSTVANPDIAITKASSPYTISLVANNIYGCKPDTFSVTFTSRVRPIAAFRLSDTLGCTGVLNVATTNLTTGASSYIWNWGDATANSAFQNPTHLYSTQGQYLVTLVASDGVCRDTASQLVKVSIKPVVNFSADQPNTCDTARVQFTNLTTNGAAYNWSFGDGTFSNITNPAKSFSPNTVPYTVKLVASSSFGCKDSLVKANLVSAKVAPVSDFFVSPSPVITVPNYTFNFNNLTLNKSNYKYLWSLGDGTFSNARDASRKYSDTGNYTIQLIVVDTITNCPDTTTKIVRIDGYPGYLYVPNAICPGCIQSNLREFIPKGAGLKEYRLQIYTTWNELIFETRTLDSKGSPTQAWDGRFKGTLLQQDVYVWRIDAKFLNGTEWLGMIYPGDSKYKKVGTITVVK